MSTPDWTRAAGTGAGTGPEPGTRERPTGVGAASAAADFLRRLRDGLDEGLDPLAAAERAATALPKTLRDSVQRMGRRMAGDYHEDEWGFDEEFAEAAYPFFEFLYEVWWRVQVEGAANVPGHGRALLVANHSGSLFPFDATMMAASIMKEHALPRWPRPLVLNWAFELPFLSFFMRKVGGVPASPFNATRLLEQDEIVMVFPEGVKGTGKPFSERYQLQRFGRGGFVEVALRTGSPVVPVAVVGAEEIYPKVAESSALARILGAPFVPITPTFPWLGPLGLIPLPSKWRIEYCEPVDLSGYGPEAAEDRGLMLEISEQIRETIQAKLYENLVKRGSAFL
ncbi:MAG: 1-acyl-sn-glycerol-3-phosphate acyltransferase [Actinomycetota bacterium]